MTFPDLPSATAGLPEWAAWCAHVGRITGAFKVFSCWPGEKLPLRRGWQQAASWDAGVVAAMWQNNPRANIGLAIQPGHIVLDCDLYKPGKEAALALYEKTHGDLPITLQFNSARGGMHFIYKTPRDLGNSAGNLPDFGDVRGYGGLIVGPGSYYEGLRYSVDNLAMPADLPAEVSGRLVERKHRAPDERRELPEFVSLDDPQNVERFVAWLKAEAQTWGDGSGHGNNTLAATGAMGSSYALSWEVTLECMGEHWNPRVEPPWDPEPLERHGGSGYRSASSSFGNMATKDPRLLFPPVSASPETFTGWGAPVVKLGDLLARGPAPARQWALGDDNDGWIPLNDLTLLYGPGGAGKTTLVGQLARSFASANPLFGSIPVRQMPVLYVGCEDDLDELHRRYEGHAGGDVRLVSLIGHDTALHPPFRFGVIPDDATETAFYQFLDHHLAAMGAGPKVLFLDNLGQIYFGDDTNKPQIVTFINRYLRRLLKAHNATGILLAHPSSAQVQSGEGGAGSPAWSANVRSHLYFDWVRERNVPVDDTRVLSRKKSNYSRVHRPGEGVFLARGNDWTFSIVARPAPPETPKAKREREMTEEEANRLFIVRKAVTDLLEAQPAKGFSGRQVAEAIAEVGLPFTTLRRYLKKMADADFPYYDPASKLWVCKAAEGQ